MHDDLKLTDSLILDKSHWRTNDKDWVKSRENLWKKDIKKRAKALSVFLKAGQYDSASLKQLGNYFVKGEITPNTIVDNLFVLLWLHPSSDKQVWRDVKKATECLDEEFTRRLFYPRSFDALYKAMQSYNLPEAYLQDGFVGDRMGKLYDIIVRDNSSKWDKVEKIVAKKQSFVNFEKGDYLISVIGSCTAHLNQNAIGQFFIDEWFERLESSGLEIETKETTEAVFLYVLLHSHLFELPAVSYERLKKDVYSPELTILMWDPKEQDSELQKRIAKTLYERIEGNTKLPPSVQIVWNNAKKLIADTLKYQNQYLK